jgi:hypothetical protein
VKGRWRIGAIFLVVVGVAVAGTFVLRPPAPAIVQELRGLAEVGRVEFSGAKNPQLLVVHVRDWHVIPKELAEPDGVDYPSLLKEAEQVQAEQVAIVRFLIRRDGIKGVYSEGLSRESMPGLDLHADLLRDMQKLGLGRLDAEERRQRGELLLTVGTPGRLLLANDIDEVLPLEDEKALQDAKPAV